MTTKKEPITAKALQAIGYDEVEGWWIHRDVCDREFSLDNGTDMKPILAIPARQVGNGKGYVQVSMFEDFGALDNDDSMTFWKMTDMSQIRAWHHAHALPLWPTVDYLAMEMRIAEELANKGSK